MPTAEYAVHDRAARLLPGLHDCVPDPDYVRRLATAVARDHAGAEPMLTLLFGSYAVGNAGRTSDLDLIVVPAADGPSSKSTFVRQGIPFEIGCYPLVPLRGLLAQSVKAGALDLPSNIAASELLQGCSNLHADLVAAAVSVLALPGPVLNDHARSQMRWRATSMLLKFQSCRSAIEQIMVGGRLVQLMAFLLLRFATGWSFSRPDYALTALAERDRQSADELSDAFAALVEGGGPELLASAAEAALERIGGACWDGVTEAVAGPIRPHPA